MPISDHKPNKSYLITGGTGSIGSEIARSLIASGAKNLTIFSRDDSKHFYLQEELGKNQNVRFILGDIRNRDSLAAAFEEPIDYVIHAAALKHVLICEQNPAEAVRTNILGTQNVVDLAKRAQVEKMITISTDKAVNPSSTMGASKYVAEKLTLDGNSTGKTKYACVRFGNVLGSRGSVIPNMHKSIAEKNCLWISDSKVTRFAMPIPEASKLVIDALADCQGGEIFVLKMKAFVLGQLAEAFREVLSKGTDFKVETRGIIGAEKMHEELVSSEEAKRLWETENHYIIEPIGGIWYPEKSMYKAKIEHFNSVDAEKFEGTELQAFIKNYISSLNIQ